MPTPGKPVWLRQSLQDGRTPQQPASGVSGVRGTSNLLPVGKAGTLLGEGSFLSQQAPFTLLAPVPSTLMSRVGLPHALTHLLNRTGSVLTFAGGLAVGRSCGLSTAPRRC